MIAALMVAFVLARVGHADAQPPLLPPPRAMHVLVGTLGEGPNNWLFSVRMAFTLAHWLDAGAKVVLPCVSPQGVIYSDKVAPELRGTSNVSVLHMRTTGCVPLTRYWNFSALEAEGVSLEDALRRLKAKRETVCFLVVRRSARFTAAVAERGEGYVFIRSGMLSEVTHARALRALLAVAGASLLVLVNGDRARDELAADLAFFRRVREVPHVVRRALWLREISSGPNGTIALVARAAHTRGADEFVPPVDALWDAARMALRTATAGAPFIALHWRVEMMPPDHKSVEFCIKAATAAVARERDRLALPVSAGVLVMSDMPDLHSCAPQRVLGAADSSCAVWTQSRAAQYVSAEVRGAFERVERVHGWVLLKRHVVPQLRARARPLDTGLGQLLVEQLVSAHASVFVANVETAQRSRMWTYCSQGRSTASCVMLAQKVVRGAASQVSWR